MLEEKAGIKIATYADREQLNFTEINQADVLVFKQRLDGGIYTPENIVWFGDLAGINNAKDYVLSKRGKKSLEKTLNYFQEAGFKVELKEMDEALFADFKSLYENTTMKKERALTFDLESTILGRIKVGKKCYLIGLYKEEILRSALVFTINDGIAVVSFGAKEKFPKIRGGIGAILEYQLIKFALENKLKSISHGKAINPIGLFSSTGLFEFKARYGFSAFPTGHWQTIFILNENIALGDLIFITILDNQLSYLVVSDEPLEILTKKYRTRAIKHIVKADKTSFYLQQQAGLQEVIKKQQ